MEAMSSDSLPARGRWIEMLTYMGPPLCRLASASIDQRIAVRSRRGLAYSRGAITVVSMEVLEMLTDAPARPTIAVSDLDKAKAFYGDTLGLKHVQDNPGGSRFEAGGTYIELYASEFGGSAKNTVAGFEVSDLDATMSRLRQKG